MSKKLKQRRSGLRTFCVGYYLEEGFKITVKANSAAAAERLVARRLDDEAGELDGSTRVHFFGDVTHAEEVRS